MSVQSLAENPLGCSVAEWETRLELATLYRAADHYGMGDITNQTICARVRGAPDQFLTEPRGMMFEEVRASDLIKVDLSGRVLDGAGIWDEGGGLDFEAVSDRRWASRGAVNLGQWIFGARPDRNYFIHAHCEPVQAVSATQSKLIEVSHAAIYLGHLIDYLEYDFDEDEDYAALFCRTIADHEIIIARNHGYYTIGSRASEAFFRAYYLREACSVQMKAAATAAGLGERLVPIDPQRVAMLRDQMAASPHYGYDGATEWGAVLRKMNRLYPDLAT